jgi:hypothetical protein
MGLPREEGGGGVLESLAAGLLLCLMASTGKGVQCLAAIWRKEGGRDRFRHEIR